MSITTGVACTVALSTGFDEFGQRTTGLATRQRCAVVHLKENVNKTSVRSDVTASTGRASETTVDARLLFRPGIAALGAKVVVHGISLRVVEVFPRFSVAGVHDHDQVDCDAWSEGA